MNPFQMSAEQQLRMIQLAHEHMSSCRYGNPQFSYGCDEGKSLRELSEERKKQGTAALNNGNYQRAMGLYVQALGGALQVKNNEEQVGVLLSNLSHVHVKMGDHENALTRANDAVVVRPMWYKGHLRMIHAFIALEKYDEAFAHGVSVYPSLKMMSYTEMFAIFESIVTLLPKLKDPLLVEKLEVGDEVWCDAIKNLSKKNEWEAISVLLLGRDHLEPLVNLKNIQFPVKELEMSGLLKASSVSDSDWKSWGERLAVKLVQEGARIDSMDPGGKYGLHAAFGVGLRTGTFNLVNHLFLHKIPMSDRDRVDDDGNTLLHLACRSTSSKTLQAVKLLLEHNLNPTCRNKQNKKPLDLIIASCPDRTKFLNLMIDRGFDSSSVMSTEEPEKSCSSSSAGPLLRLRVDTKTGDMSEKVSPTSDSLVLMPDSTTESTSADLTSLETLDQVKRWNTKKLEEWASNHGILATLKRFDILECDLLIELKMMQLTSPTSFFALLHDNMKLTYLDILKLSSAIRRIGQ